MPPLVKIPWLYKRDKEELVREVRAELEKVLRRGGEEGFEFICKYDIEAIWTVERIQRLSQGLSWMDPGSLNRVRKEFRIILSILVWMRWDEWQHFQKIFLNHRNRTDEDLPLDDDRISLTSHLRREFISLQYRFIPVVLVEEDQYADHNVEYDQRYRMPSLKSEIIGGGAGGVVTKELIAVKYFQSAGDGSGLNTKERWVAKKSIEKSNKTGPNEQGNLRFLKQGSRGHGNIMHSYTSFTHGKYFVILSQLADLDLFNFFQGKYPDFEERKLRFTTFDLLKEAACLADALDFLHYRLRLGDSGKKVACAHLDFKPENVLVKWSSDENRMPVGQWLVHDFGISKIKESPDENTSTLRAPGDILVHFSLTKAQRVPGPFQAPEVQKSEDRVVGRESDMWSFGCLLAVIICFAIGGPKRFFDLYDSMYNNVPSNQSDTDYFYTIIDGKAVLKPTVTSFLDRLRTDEEQDSWVGETLDLVYKILKDDPKQRLTGFEACEALDIITGKGEPRLRNKCSWIKPETTIPVENVENFHISTSGDTGSHPVNQPHSSSIPPWSGSRGMDPRLNGQNLNLALNNMQNDGLHVTSQFMPLPPNPAQSPNLSAYPSLPQSQFFPPPSHQPLPQQISPSWQANPQLSFSYPPTFQPQYSRDYTPHNVPQNMQQNPPPHVQQYHAQYGAPQMPTFAGEPRRPSIVLWPERTTTLPSVAPYPHSPYPSQSDESSSFAKSSSQTMDMAFMHFPTPPNTIKSAVCAASKRVAFLSKHSVKIYNLNIQRYWVPKKPQKPPDQVPYGFFDAQDIKPPEGHGFEWDMISLSREYLLLRARNQVECRFCRYMCHQRVENAMTKEFWIEEPFILGVGPAPDQIAKHVLETSINWRGEVLFSLNATLCCYTLALGLHTLENRGQLRRACFSSDGQYIFAWTLGDFDQQENCWYIWNSSDTSVYIMNKKTKRITAERTGSGRNGLIFPLSRYFAAFEIPNRLYIVGKDANRLQVSQLRSPVDNIVAGSGYEIAESQAQGLALVQKHSSPRFMNLPFASDLQGSTPLDTHKLQEGFNVETNGIAVVTEMNSVGTFLIVSHSSGLVERRKIVS